MPGQMVISTESVIGYNNKLKQAIAGMKLGVNDSVNQGTKKAGLRLMDGGPSKVNQPNSHHSNPIHKAATAESKPALPTKKMATSSQTKEPKEQWGHPRVEESMATADSGSGAHNLNKIAVAVGAVAVAGLVVLALR